MVQLSPLALQNQLKMTLPCQLKTCLFRESYSMHIWRMICTWQGAEGEVCPLCAVFQEPSAGIAV